MSNWKYFKIVVGLLLVVAIGSLGLNDPSPKQREDLLEVVEVRGVIPLAHWIEVAVDWLYANLGVLFDSITYVLTTIFDGLQALFDLLPVYFISIANSYIAFPLLLVLIAPYLFYVDTLPTAIFSIIGLWFIANVGLWSKAMETFALTITASSISLFLGIPIGLLAGNFDPVESSVRPVLDVMQTLSAFIYLIPAIVFFGLGAPPAIFATCIFSIPPAVRLTNLGIREIPHELIEAGQAFGANRMQLLWKVQIPTAFSSIMAGVNQTIMLALSMSVIAAMIGAGGLGSPIVKSIRRMMIGKGFVAGFCVVTVAIILDRGTRNIGRRPEQG